MAIDKLRQFVQLRKDLLQEKNQLESRLREINAVLETELAGEQGSSESERSPRGGAGKRRGVRGENPKSLRQTIMEVVTRPMTKQEILDGVLATGYRFATTNPMNSINVILYGRKPRFEKKDGKFLLGK